MICPERTTNLVRGKGFHDNDYVLQQFVDAGKYQEALDYFGFEGRYKGSSINSGRKDVEGSDFYGSTNPQTGAISYGNAAFDSYKKLLCTYIKERYHSQKIMNGYTFERQDFGIKYAPEERLGVIYAYRKSGLFIGSGIDVLSQIYFYQYKCYELPQSLFYNKKFWHFIYKTPRKW